MESFTHAYDEKVRPLMDKIDQIRSILSSNEDGITFPNVVVVGDQSSGKSTLLEALSMVELPKGSGIVTRCPLVLRLRRSMKRQVYRLYDGNKKDLLDESKLNILKYIEEETKKLAGKNKNVVHDLIEILVEDPNVRDLTVVDLPGIARNPIADQPKNIHKQTTDLIRKFISQQGTVILCVFPANVDVATVESFTLARKYDSVGNRTIGVITKSDLAPNQESFIQQLLMEKSDVLKLTLGFVAVRNRSTDETLSLEDARRREKEFFQNHQASALVGWHCLGIDALINRLADLYSDRVKEIFPKMREDIQKKLRAVCEELYKFPPDLDTPAARLAKYYELTDFYIENDLKLRFSNIGDGQYVSMINELHKRCKQFEKIVETNTMEIASTKYHEKVRKAMADCLGEQLPNFLPHPVLKRLIGEKLDQLLQITNTLINECFRLSYDAIMDKRVSTCKDDILFQKLLPIFRDIGKEYLRDRKQHIHEQIQELIRLEKHDPYTLNQLYIDKINVFEKDLLSRKTNFSAAEKPVSPSIKRNSFAYTYDQIMFTSTLQESEEVQEMLLSIYCYWKVITKRFTDYVALSLRAACNFDICSGIRDRLRNIPTVQCDFVDSHLAEDVYIRTKRKQLQQTRDRLRKVDAILGGHTGNSNETVDDSWMTSTSSDMSLDALEKSLIKPNIHT